MSLQNKFRFLLAIFGVSIVANVLVSVWCIHIYMAQATERFQLLMFQARDTERLRLLLDELTSDLRRGTVPADDVDTDGYTTSCRRIGARLAALPFGERDENARSLIEDLSGRLEAGTERYAELVSDSRHREALALVSKEIVPEIIVPLQRVLSDVATESDVSLTHTSADIAGKQALVTAILAGNALLAFLLAATGVHLVRNWVLKPVETLKTAVEIHSSGDLHYRIERHSNDELGTLSEALNRMADSLLEIRNRLVQQERLAAIGEVASTIAHNIRNPLAGIRASAQSSMMELPEESESHARQMQMIETVDSLNRWVRELLMVSQPIRLQTRPVCMAETVERVVSVMKADADRRGIRFEVLDASASRAAEVDAARIEQALLVVVGNAVEASPQDSIVSIEIDKSDEGGSWVELSVMDSGPGISAEIVEKIGTAGFTTKPGGTGTGLYQAQRIVQAHGGTIVFQNNSGGGTKVSLRLPAG